ncbi:hypothetical protein [Prosthecobacter sp.]|uniref:hypothetical protein n=1 Tax=Prosthecobacter sp. TaxID=1965333 RepID=UPI003783B724
MNTLSSKTPPPAAATAPVNKRTSWYLTGLALIVAGVACIPTMFLAAIGGGLILIGIATITAAFIQTHRRPH